MHAVADILLWRNIKMSVAITVGITLIWFLFEVVDYNFVTFFSHVSIATLLIVFIWCSAAEFFNWYCLVSISFLHSNNLLIDTLFFSNNYKLHALRNVWFNVFFGQVLLLQTCIENFNTSRFLDDNNF